MPKKKQIKQRKEWSEKYRTESQGNESFNDFVYKYKKSKKPGII